MALPTNGPSQIFLSASHVAVLPTRCTCPYRLLRSTPPVLPSRHPIVAEIGRAIITPIRPEAGSEKDRHSLSSPRKRGGSGNPSPDSRRHESRNSSSIDPILRQATRVSGERPRGRPPCSSDPGRSGRVVPAGAQRPRAGRRQVRRSGSYGSPDTFRTYRPVAGSLRPRGR